MVVLYHGIIWLNLTIVSLYWSFLYYKKVEDKILKGMMIFLPIVGLIMCIAIIVMGGSLQRYSVDFFWMLSMFGMIVWFLMYKTTKSIKNRKYILEIVFVLILMSVIINFLGTFFNSEYDYLKNYYPKIFNYFKMLFSI